MPLVLRSGNPSASSMDMFVQQGAATATATMPLHTIAGKVSLQTDNINLYLHQTTDPSGTMTLFVEGHIWLPVSDSITLFMQQGASQEAALRLRIEGAKVSGVSTRSSDGYFPLTQTMPLMINREVESVSNLVSIDPKGLFPIYVSGSAGIDSLSESATLSLYANAPEGESHKAMTLHILGPVRTVGTLRLTIN